MECWTLNLTATPHCLEVLRRTHLFLPRLGIEVVMVPGTRAGRAGGLATLSYGTRLDATMAPPQRSGLALPRIRSTGAFPHSLGLEGERFSAVRFSAECPGGSVGEPPCLVVRGLSRVHRGRGGVEGRPGRKSYSERRHGIRSTWKALALEAGITSQGRRVPLVPPPRGTSGPTTVAQKTTSFWLAVWDVQGCC